MRLPRIFFFFSMRILFYSFSFSTPPNGVLRVAPPSLQGHGPGRALPDGLLSIFFPHPFVCVLSLSQSGEIPALICGPTLPSPFPLTSVPPPLSRVLRPVRGTLTPSSTRPFSYGPAGRIIVFRPSATLPPSCRIWLRKTRERCKAISSATPPWQTLQSLPQVASLHPPCPLRAAFLLLFRCISSSTLPVLFSFQTGWFFVYSKHFPPFFRPGNFPTRRTLSNLPHIFLPSFPRAPFTISVGRWSPKGVLCLRLSFAHMPPFPPPSDVVAAILGPSYRCSRRIFNDFPAPFSEDIYGAPYISFSPPFLFSDLEKWSVLPEHPSETNYLNLGIPGRVA